MLYHIARPLAQASWLQDAPHFAKHVLVIIDLDVLRSPLRVPVIEGTWHHAYSDLKCISPPVTREWQPAADYLGHYCGARRFERPTLLASSSPAHDQPCEYGGDVVQPLKNINPVHLAWNRQMLKRS
jgi:hypothetical protein